MAPPAEPRRLRILGVLGFLSWLHLYLGAWFGILVVTLFGPDVAMGNRILEGDTEPSRPDLRFAWWPVALLAALPLPWVFRRKWAVATAASVPLVALPVVHLVRLLLAPIP